MAEDNRSLIELPRVNLEGVLTKLPLPSLFACCCVSKSLLNLIKNDSDFAQIHLATSEPQLMIQACFDSSVNLIDLDTDTTSRVEVKPSFNTPLDGCRVAHSSNGLVLLESFNMAPKVHRCVLYNPVRGEYTLLPEPVTPRRTVTSVLFYCPTTHQFKVFCAFYPLSPSSDVSSDSFMELDPSSDSDSDMEVNLISDVDIESDDPEAYADTESASDSADSLIYAIGEIYVRGSDSWESLGNIPFDLPTINFTCHLEKAVHWVCEEEAVPNIIIFFNFETHEFGEIPGPPHIGKTHTSSHDLTLVALGNRLSIFDQITTGTMFDVWVMKEYGVKDSWCREYVIDTVSWCFYDLERKFIPVVCRNNGEVVMVSDHGYILFFDLLLKKGRIVKHPTLQSTISVGMHTPSLISLKDVVRGSNLEVVNVESSPSRFADPRMNANNFLKLTTVFIE